MQLRELSIEELQSPLKVKFQHAAFDRSNAESVLVRAVGANAHRDILLTRDLLDPSIEFGAQGVLQAEGVSDLRAKPYR